jgi:hypothetical protein
MKVQVLFNTNGDVLSLLRPSTGDRNARAVFRPGHGQHSAELEVPTELSGLRLLEIHSAVIVDLVSKRLVKRPDAPTIPLPPPR